ncbi:MAG: YhcH/YjgK/YiaL family protein [Desulfovibrionaceae bacterium]
MIVAKYSDSQMFFSTQMWKEIYGYFDEIKKLSFGQHIFASHWIVSVEQSPKSEYAIECHKHCVVQFVLEGRYSVYSAKAGMLKQYKEYDQDKDQALFFKGDMQEHIMHVGDIIIFLPQETYMPNSKSITKVATCTIPYYLLLYTKMHVEIVCFSLIHRFMPENPKKYPILEGWTVNTVIDSLGIDREVVRVVFINDTAVPKTTKLENGMRISLFPGIGGG